MASRCCRARSRSPPRAARGRPACRTPPPAGRRPPPAPAPAARGWLHPGVPVQLRLEVVELALRSPRHPRRRVAGGVGDDVDLEDVGHAGRVYWLPPRTRRLQSRPAAGSSRAPVTRGWFAVTPGTRAGAGRTPVSQMTFARTAKWPSRQRPIGRDARPPPARPMGTSVSRRPRRYPGSWSRSPTERSVEATLGTSLRRLPRTAGSGSITITSSKKRLTAGTRSAATERAQPKSRRAAQSASCSSAAWQRGAQLALGVVSKQPGVERRRHLARRPWRRSARSARRRRGARPAARCRGRSGGRGPSSASGRGAP